MFGDLYQLFLYQPLLNLLIFFYDFIPGKDIGVAIIVLTILVRILLYPLSQKTLKSQKLLQEIQPKVEELKKKYADNKEMLASELMKVYSENKVNPFSSCLPLLIQLPIFIALYQTFQAGLTSSSFNLLYPFIPSPGSISPVSFGFLDLSKAQPVLALLAGLAQYYQSKMMITKKQPAMAGSEDEKRLALMNKQMMYMMPVLTVVIGFSLPGGLTLYWLLTTVLMVLQQYLMFKKKLN